MWTLFLCAWLLASPGDSTVLLVRVLDVSDARIGGDAILITDSVGSRARHILLDASDHSATVLAHLRQFRVDTLAAVILSHPHADHYGGMAGVIAQIPVRSFIYGGTPRNAQNYVALLQAIAARQIAVVVADTGVRTVRLITNGDTVTLRILAPPRACHALGGAAGGDAVNNCSLGVRLTRGTFAMFLPGDAEQKEIGWWMTTHPTLLRADVLKAGHHGSSNATTMERSTLSSRAPCSSAPTGVSTPSRRCSTCSRPVTSPPTAPRIAVPSPCGSWGRGHGVSPPRARGSATPAPSTQAEVRHEGSTSLHRGSPRGKSHRRGSRWRRILRPAALAAACRRRGDDVLGVTVEAEADRAVITIVRDAGATARAKADAAAAVAQLKRRDPGGDVQL
jgi:beta-lactamase superfamily II metal-dependent hydrolase